jgi:hypothetical protein
VRVLPKKVNWRRLIGLASRWTQLRACQSGGVAIAVTVSAYSSRADDGRHVGATAAPWTLLRGTEATGQRAGKGILRRIAHCCSRAPRPTWVAFMAG